MKKMFLFLLLITSVVFSCFSQNDLLPISKETGQICFTDVVLADSLKSDVLFINASKWVAKSFVSGKEATQLSDKESGTIIIKSNIPVLSEVLVRVPIGVVKFTLTISIKDFKYKYCFDSFWHDVSNMVNNNVFTPGDLRAEKPGGGILTMGMKNWIAIKVQTSQRISFLIDDLKKSMKLQGIANDNW